MTRFIVGRDRRQTLLLPECLDDYATQDNPVRVIDAFIEDMVAAVRAVHSSAEGPPRDRPSAPS